MAFSVSSISLMMIKVISAPLTPKYLEWKSALYDVTKVVLCIIDHLLWTSQQSTTL